MTKLEIAAYDQMVLAREAEQKAEDLGYAFNLLLNDGFEKFHIAQTPDGATHEFLSELVPVVSISPRVRSNARNQKILIILWKTTFGPRNIHGSAYREDEFKMSPPLARDSCSRTKETASRGNRKALYWDTTSAGSLTESAKGGKTGAIADF